MRQVCRPTKECSLKGAKSEHIILVSPAGGALEAVRNNVLDVVGFLHVCVQRLRANERKVHRGLLGCGSRARFVEARWVRASVGCRSTRGSR